jgi:hypothetical protein
MVNILEDLTSLLQQVDIPIETGSFGNKPPNKYLVLTPVYEDFDLHGDNIPIIDVHWARISLFDKGNYITSKEIITELLLSNDFHIQERTYVEYEPDTKYHHYAIDVQKYYIREVQ